MSLRTSLTVARRRPASIAATAGSVALCVTIGVLFSAPFALVLYVLFAALNALAGGIFAAATLQWIAWAVTLPVVALGGVYVGLDLAKPHADRARLAFDDEVQRARQSEAALDPGSASGGVSLPAPARGGLQVVDD